MSFDVDRRVGWPPFFQYRFQTIRRLVEPLSPRPPLTRRSSAKDLKAIEIPLPPLPEQRLIAGTLGDADAVIGALEALIAKKRDINQGAMRELLTGKRRLPGFEGSGSLSPSVAYSTSGARSPCRAHSSVMTARSSMSTTVTSTRASARTSILRQPRRLALEKLSVGRLRPCELVTGSLPTLLKTTTASPRRLRSPTCRLTRMQ